MKNKIGIITFHKACNYGAVLQAYALQTKLKKMFWEYDVEIIDYYCPAIEDRTSPFYYIKDGNFIKNVLRYMYLFIPKYKRYKKFNEFREKYLSATRIRYDIENINRVSDDFLAVFVGSDQVWNINATKGDRNYFLEPLSDRVLKCSYAASFGFEEVVKEHYDEILSMVKKFNYISVRESIGIDDLFNKNNIKATVNVDPTMLLERKEWDELIVDVEKMPKKGYILLYCVLKTNRLVNYAKNLSEKTGLQVYSISNQREFSEFKQIKNCGVEEFISLVKNANYVLTTSFHGTVFSILYHKKFVTEIDTWLSRNTRVENLLETLDMKSRTIENSKFDIDSEIRWDAVEAKLKACVKNAENYLNTIKIALEGEE